MFEIRVDDRELKALERNIKRLGGSMQTVMTRALNKTATTSRVEISRELSKRVGIPVGKVKAMTQLHKASRFNWRSAVTLSGRRFALTEFKARQIKAGISYRQPSTRSRVLIRSAFMATMPIPFSKMSLKGMNPSTPSGHVGAFKRKGRGRLPIVELRGPSLAGLYGGATDLTLRIFRESQQRLEQNIANQVQLILNRKGAA